MLQTIVAAAAAVVVVVIFLVTVATVENETCVRRTWLSCAACDANALPQCLHCNKPPCRLKLLSLKVSGIHTVEYTARTRSY